MRTVTAHKLQTWFDLAIQYTGSVYNAIDIAAANGAAISDDPQEGQVVTIPEGLMLDAKVVQYFQARALVPATGYVERSPVVINYEFPQGEFPISF